MVGAMSSRTYRCPSCNQEVDQRAAQCGNPTCRRPLAFCSRCRDVTTYTEEPSAAGRFARKRYRCDRCEATGVRCYTSLAGGYCNGLARAGAHLDQPLCALCSERAADIGRNVVGYALMGAIGLVLNKRRK